jgi:hypothetical protein
MGMVISVAARAQLRGRQKTPLLEFSVHGITAIAAQRPALRASMPRWNRWHQPLSMLK